MWNVNLNVNGVNIAIYMIQYNHIEQGPRHESRLLNNVHPI